MHVNINPDKYVARGDVNAEAGTMRVTLAMCGLTSTTTPPVVVAGFDDPEAGGLYCSGCGKQARTDGQDYKRCGRCQACYYCSVSCQRAHWDAGHEKDCWAATMITSWWGDVAELPERLDI